MDSDLTVLEQSPYAVAPAKIKDIKVWGTMLEGRVQPVPAAAKRAKQSARAEVARSPNQAAPEVILPDAIHHHPRR